MTAAKLFREAVLYTQASQHQLAKILSNHVHPAPGAGFMKGLKSGLRLKSETLGSNIVNILLSLWTQTQSISETGST